MGAQVPLAAPVFIIAQAMHVPRQVVLQQKLSVQWPLVHSLPAPQLVPFGFFPHWPATQ
jgi:hypothetical protein